MPAKDVLIGPGEGETDGLGLTDGEAEGEPVGAIEGDGRTDGLGSARWSRPAVHRHRPVPATTIDRPTATMPNGTREREA